MKKKPIIKDVSTKAWEDIEKEAEERNKKEHIALADSVLAEDLLPLPDSGKKDN